MGDQLVLFLKLIVVFPQVQETFAELFHVGVELPHLHLLLLLFKPGLLPYQPCPPPSTILPSPTLIPPSTLLPRPRTVPDGPRSCPASPTNLTLLQVYRLLADPADLVDWSGTGLTTSRPASLEAGRTAVTGWVFVGVGVRSSATGLFLCLRVRSPLVGRVSKLCTQLLLVSADVAPIAGERTDSGGLEA